MTIVLHGERIESVIPDVQYVAEPRDQVIPLSGAAVMPGMAQGHFHSHFGAVGDGVRAPSLGSKGRPPTGVMLLGASGLVLASLYL